MKRTLLTFALSIAFVASFMGQVTPADLKFDENDTMPNDSVIFTEILLPNWNHWGYVEITNMSSDTVEMANFFILGRYPDRTGESFLGNDNKKNLKGTLLPGESYVIVIADVRPLDLDEAGNQLYENGLLANKMILKATDTLFTEGSQIGARQFALLSRYRNAQTGIVDSARTDAFNCLFRADNPANTAISGLGPGLPTYVLWFRKTNFKMGNIDWNNSRGNDLADSEWNYVTHNLLRGYNDFPYTTVGSHFKNETFNVTSKGRAQIDMTNKKITFPYGVRRDSLFRNEFSYGPNIAWDLKIGPDTSQFYVQTNDTIYFYLPGDSVIEYAFHVEVEPITNSFNSVRPLVYKNVNGNYTYKYTYSNGVSPMDTIGMIPYDESVDSLLKYVKIETGCTYEIIPANGKQSPDLRYGDILKVTAPDNSVKQYKLAVEAYVEDYIADLSRVVFPGLELWENANTFMYTDTFLNFSGQSYDYVIELPEGTEVSPAMVATPVFPNTRIIYQKAKNLFGSKADKTAKIIAISENAVDTLTYSFEFNVLRATPVLDYSPFFCDLGTDWAVANSYITQLFNPSDETLDLTDYVIVQLRNADNHRTLAEIGTRPRDELNNRTLRFGHIVLNNPNGKPHYYTDFAQWSTSIPAKGVFSLANYRSYPFEGNGNSQELSERVDFIVRQNYNSDNRIDKKINPWIGFNNGFDTIKHATPGLFGPYNPTSFNSGGSIVLLRITNDSVKDGSKAMNDFVNDYEVVDVVNGVNTVGQGWKIWNRIDGKDTIYREPGSHKWNLYRKSNVYKGNPVDRLSFGVGTDSIVNVESEWVVYGYAGAGVRPEDQVGVKVAVAEREVVSRKRFDNHTMEYSAHLPYVLSTVYVVSVGIEGEQSIDGVSPSTSVTTFLNNLITPSADMRLVVYDNANNPKLANDIVSSSDKLYSYSARGTDSVIYAISVGALDNNTLLTSTNYTITQSTDKKTGTIAGVPFGTKLADVIDKLVKPETAKMLITNGEGEAVPSVIYNRDSSKLVFDEDFGLLIWKKVDVQLAGSMYVEVTAQNGDVCLYSFSWENAADPYVISSIYVVDELNKEIQGASGAFSLKTFMQQVSAAPGCTFKITNSNGEERVQGDLKHDDRLVVTNGTKSVTYFIKFYEGNSYVGIESVDGVTKAQVYPNPSTGLYRLNNLSGAKTLKVYDMTGKMVRNLKVTSSEMNLNLTAEPKGIYLVKVDGKISSTLKLVKE
jgi:hypothetical protein